MKKFSKKKSINKDKIIILDSSICGYFTTISLLNEEICNGSKILITDITLRELETLSTAKNKTGWDARQILSKFNNNKDSFLFYNVSILNVKYFIIKFIKQYFPFAVLYTSDRQMEFDCKIDKISCKFFEKSIEREAFHYLEKSIFLNAGKTNNSFNILQRENKVICNKTHELQEKDNIFCFSKDYRTNNIKLTHFIVFKENDQLVLITKAKLLINNNPEIISEKYKAIYDIFVQSETL